MQIGAGEQFYDFAKDRLDDAPGTSAPGVFVLFKKHTCVFVGASTNVRSALERLLDGSNPCIAKLKPTVYQYQVSLPDRSEALMSKLVHDYKPECH